MARLVKKSMKEGKSREEIEREVNRFLLPLDTEARRKIAHRTEKAILEIWQTKRDHGGDYRYGQQMLLLEQKRPGLMVRLFDLFGWGRSKTVTPPKSKQPIPPKSKQPPTPQNDDLPPTPGILEPTTGELGGQPGDFALPVSEREKRKSERELFGPEIADPFLKGILALFVDSSWLQLAKYDPDEEALKVEFLDGHKHTYVFTQGNGFDMAKSFLRANTKGVWMWDNIFIRGAKNENGTIPVRSGIKDYEGW